MMRLGSATIDRIADIETFRLPLGMLFPGAELADLAGARAWLAPDHVDFDAGHLLLGLQSHLVRVAGLTILVDTCVGEDKERPNRPDWHRRRETGYLARLAEASLRPDEVDLVLCTHLHADHVGWNTRLENGRWVPTFPNARYLIGATELAHWQEVRGSGSVANHGAYEDSVLPIVEAGRAVLVEDGHEIAGGVTLLPLPGHTPGQVGLRLDARAAGHAIFCADAIHSPAQVARPDWSSAFCTDPEAARTTRLALLEEAAETDTLLIPAHLRRATGMRLRRQGGGFHPAFCGCDGENGR